MPDWFYRTVSRPVLFALSAERSRNFALGFMGTLCRLPLGPQVIDFLGHMGADARLATTVLGVTFPTPLGIGPHLDAGAVALPALARFGVGFLEVGPVTLAGGAGAAPLLRRPDQQAVWLPDPPASLSLADAMPKLREARQQGIPLVVRMGASGPPEQVGAELDHLTARLAEAADLVVLTSLAPALAGGWSEEAWRDHLRRVAEAMKRAATPRPLLLAVPIEGEMSALERFLAVALEEGIAGFLLDGNLRAEGGGRVVGLPAYALALQRVKQLRERWPGVAIVGAGGVHEPEQALEMMQAGADLVSTDTGLVFTGPGLPKRINDALLYAQHAEKPAPGRPPERTWFWTTLMGTAMFLGGVFALLIASTRIILPYDEEFVKMTRAQLDEVNPRLLAFLAHDRVSLAGAMLTTGIGYLGLSLFGIRRGLHWAQQSVFYSAFAGFGAFFLFLGYGYLDPFHAFITCILFQFLLLGLHSQLGPPPVPESPQLVGDWRWRLGLWGQLLLIVHALGVLTGGLVISGFGVTRVFVPEDLEFMQTTAEELKSANRLLLPLIAHDRATFGGNLVAVGLLLLLPALWGPRPNSAWLWWTLVLAVVPGYMAAIAVHYVVGYNDLFHLSPAYGGLALFLLAMVLSRPYWCQPGAEEAEWRRFRAK